MIKPRACIIKTTGEEITVEPADGKYFTIDELYKHTGSTIVQQVSLPSIHSIIICDEEGMFNDKKPNEVATLLGHIHGIYMPPEGMLGDVLVCHESMLEQ